MLGVVDDVLADRAFIEERRTSAAELATLDDVRGDGPRARAAPGLERAGRGGARPRGRRAGGGRARRPARFPPDPHRIAHVASHAGVTYVDDSKATNPPAAAASLSAFDHVVWVAGGLLKGADVDDLVRAHAAGCAVSCSSAATAHQIAQAIARHAPDVPVVDVASTDTGVMDDVVRLAS